MLATAIPLNWPILLLNPWPLPGGSCKEGLSYSPKTFLELGLYFFLELRKNLWAHTILWLVAGGWINEGFFPNKNCNLTPCNYVQKSMVLWKLGFLKKKFFTPKNGENRPSQGFFECIWKFSDFFFSVWSIIEFYIECCMLWKILENVGSWDMANQIAGF